MYPEGVHGYQLGRRLSRSPLGLPLLGLGQLYRALHHLEGSGLVEGQIEVNGSRRARYRFTMTAKGGTAFQQWLTRMAKGSLPVRDQLLNRLRFADQLSGSDLHRFLNEAVRECRAELEQLTQESKAVKSQRGGAKSLHSMALEARLVADRRWLEAVQQLVETAGPPCASEVPPGRTRCSVNGCNSAKL
jgi:DNA-binding PadR family transcriptional regulator